LRLLGAGGMGIVFLAEDTNLLRSVALKVVQPRIASDAVTRQRFLREARAMAAIHHEHVVVVYHVGTATTARKRLELPYLAMQYIQGETLLDYLVRDGRLAFFEVARIGREIAEGLEAAHAEGVIHRDIKPSNIWLTVPRRRVKIIDFGLARPLQGNTAFGSTAISYSKQIIGTPYFMSPEQALGEPIDQRSDLFSLGCLLYSALSGTLPFDGSTPVAVLSKLAIDEPTPLQKLRPDVPPQFAHFIHRLLAKLPDNRPPTASSAVNALEEIEDACRFLNPPNCASP
jgi:serine/threonine protein kinase